MDQYIKKLVGGNDLTTDEAEAAMNENYGR